MIETITLTRCDRCDNIMQAIEPRAECDPDGFVEFSIDFHGAGLRYYDLCPRCDKTLKRLWAQAQPTEGKRKGEEVAP